MLYGRLRQHNIKKETSKSIFFQTNIGVSRILYSSIHVYLVETFSMRTDPI